MVYQYMGCGIRYASFLQTSWDKTIADTFPTGYTWSFAAQAIICTFGVVPVYLLLQKFGPHLRRPMHLGKAQ